MSGSGEGARMTLHQLRRRGVVYIGSPYSLYRDGLAAAAEDVADIAAYLMHHGVRWFCPVTMGHPVGGRRGIDPRDQARWERQNLPFMRMCGALVVAELDGWRDSAGLRGEIDYFERAGKPILYLDPEGFDLSASPHPQERPFA